MAATGNHTLLKALGLGALAGLRSLSGPSLLSHHAAQHHTLEDTPFAWLGTRQASLALSLMSVGEVLADKLPFMPDRTSPPALLGRAGLGGLVGAALFSADDQSPAIGALIGATAAVLATFAGYHLRKRAGEQWQVPDMALGIAEDAVVYGLGRTLLLGD